MMMLLKLLAVVLAVLGTYVLPNEYALMLLAVAVVWAIGPRRLLLMLAGVYLIMRSLSS